MPRGVYDRSVPLRRQALRVVERPGEQVSDIGFRADQLDGMTKEELKDRIAKLDKDIGDAIAAHDMTKTELQIALNDIRMLEARCALYERLLDHLVRE